MRRGRPALSEDDIAAARARIADVAERLFREEGFAAVSMRRLAQEAGCAPMTLYNYFASKADILRGIWLRFLEELFDDLERRHSDDPAERLVLISQAYVSYWLDHPDRYRMFFMSEGVTQEDVGAFVGTPGVLSRYALFDEALAAAGPSPRRKLLFEALVCGLNGVAQAHITASARDWEDGEALAAAIAGAIWAQACADA